MWRRLRVPALESVDDGTQLEQIAELAEGDTRVALVALVVTGGRVGAHVGPVGPSRWNERPAAIGQDDEHKPHAAPLDAVDNAERLPFERVAPADNRHLIQNIAEMGSLSCLPSTR